MQRPSWMACEPFADLGMFVGGVIVYDRVDGLAVRHGAFDVVQEAGELLIRVALLFVLISESLRNPVCASKCEFCSRSKSN